MRLRCQIKRSANDGDPEVKTRKTDLRRALLIAAAGLLIAGGPAWSQTAQTQDERKPIMTMQDDLAHRAPEIHWPAGFDPAKADLFSHNELLIGAPCERVWQHIVDATKWPEWYPNSKDVRIVKGTQLAQGTVFRWTTFGLPLESKINEFVPYTRIGWYGYAPGTTPSATNSFYHTWFLTPAGDACRVITDEVGMGKDAAHLRETDESLMHRGHDLWLATLKWTAEGR
jgi:uncharacterized protein YndB with AHSA1/START domain